MRLKPYGIQTGAFLACYWQYLMGFREMGHFQSIWIRGLGPILGENS